MFAPQDSGILVPKVDINKKLKSVKGYSYRGADMGRREFCEDPEATVYLQRVNLDSGAYDPGGAYWGHGQRLYCVMDADNKVQLFTRAWTREEALADIKKRYPDLRFHRGG